MSTADQVRAQSNRYERRVIDTTFYFSKAGSVLLGNGSATIIVTGWDQSTIRVRARSEEGGLRFDATSTKVVVEPTRSQDDVVIQIMVPRGVRVVAHTNDGDITVRETRGDVEAETSSGDVLIVDAHDVDATNLSGDLDVRHVTGTANVTTNNGDCTVTDSKGNIEASSVSGTVRIARSTSKIVRAKTTNGDLSFEGAIAPDGHYELITHSGDIDLALPKTASALIGVTTLNGTVDSEFPITLKPGFSTAANDMSTKRFTFTLGGGSARVTAETFSGDVSITSSGGK